MSGELKPGDIFVVIPDLHREAGQRRLAAVFYKNREAADDMEKQLNIIRANKFLEDAAAIDRVIAHLAGVKP